MSNFINTRPTVRADALSKAMQLKGYQVLDLPLLEMVSVVLPKDAILKLYSFSQTSNLNGYDVLIVVSPSAVEFALKVCIDGSILSLKNIKQALAHVKVIAVGQTTANALAEYGIVATVPKISSNEGMLSLSEVQELNCYSKVMVWRGQGGRQLLTNTLKLRGVQVDIIEWYTRQLPKKSMIVFQTWYQNIYHNALADVLLIEENEITSNSFIQKNIQQDIKKLATVLISSSEAFAHWQLIINNVNQRTISEIDSKYQLSLKSFNYIVLGSRLSNILKKYALNYQQVDDLSISTLSQVVFSQ